MLTWEEYMLECAMLLERVLTARNETEWEEAFQTLEEKTGVFLKRNYELGLMEEIPGYGPGPASELH